VTEQVLVETLETLITPYEQTIVSIFPSSLFIRESKKDFERVKNAFFASLPKTGLGRDFKNLLASQQNNYNLFIHLHKSEVERPTLEGWIRLLFEMSSRLSISVSTFEDLENTFVSSRKTILLLVHLSAIPNLNEGISVLKKDMSTLVSLIETARRNCVQTQIIPIGIKI